MGEVALGPQAGVPGSVAPGTTAEVYLYSGCRDDQTSADTNAFGASGGAMTNAFYQTITKGQGLTWYSVLIGMRDILHNGPHKFTQVPQLSSNIPIDPDRPFSL